MKPESRFDEGMSYFSTLVKPRFWWRSFVTDVIISTIANLITSIIVYCIGASAGFWQINWMTIITVVFYVSWAIAAITWIIGKIFQQKLRLQFIMQSIAIGSLGVSGALGTLVVPSAPLLEKIMYPILGVSCIILMTLGLWMAKLVDSRSEHDGN